MSVIVFFILVFTILQLVLGHFSLWWIIVVLGRFIFAARNFGVIVKVKSTLIPEVISSAGMVIWNILFAKNNFPWARIGWCLLFGLLCAGLECLDGLLYIYNIEDLEDEEFEIPT